MRMLKKSLAQYSRLFKESFVIILHRFHGFSCAVFQEESGRSGHGRSKKDETLLQRQKSSISALKNSIKASKQVLIDYESALRAIEEIDFDVLLDKAALADIKASTERLSTSRTGSFSCFSPSLNIAHLL